LRELCKGNKCFVITLIPLALLKDPRRLVGLDFELFHPFFLGFLRGGFLCYGFGGLLEGLGIRCICTIIWSGTPPTHAREPKAFQRLGPPAV